MNKRKGLTILSATVILVTFFLTWVSWGEYSVSGYALATGDFFKISEKSLDLANPFPALAFAFYILWLVPVLAVLIILRSITDRKLGILPYVAGFISLSLVTVYVLFTDFGVGSGAFKLITVAAWLHALAAIVLILSVYEVSLLKKLVWIIVGPVIVFASFKLIEKSIMNELHKETTDVKADFTLSSDQLIKEFMSNDSAANKKYLDKVILVNGPASAIEIGTDSTSTIRFADSTGSYAIFSLEKEELPAVKQLKTGDQVSLKGVCSGSIYSDILATTSISFKRAILNNK